MKEPQDHKQPKAAMKTATISGVTLVIDPDIFDDLDVLDQLDQINEGNALRVAGLLRKLTGDKFNDVRAALRDPETGRIPVERATEFFGELMEAMAPNSSGS